MGRIQDNLNKPSNTIEEQYTPSPWDFTLSLREAIGTLLDHLPTGTEIKAGTEEIEIRFTDGKRLLIATMEGELLFGRPKEAEK